RRAPVAEQLFTNAKVFTGESETAFASAFRIRDGHVAWVGDAAEVSGEPGTDLGGRTVLPGLIDSHTHPAVVVALGVSAECFPPAVRSTDELVAVLREHAETVAGSDAWILGRGFDDTKFPGGVMPTAVDLDRVSTDRPVLV